MLLVKCSLARNPTPHHAFRGSQVPAPGFLEAGFRSLAFAPVLAALADGARGRERLEALQVRAPPDCCRGSEVYV